MGKIKLTYERIMLYLKDLLSDQQRHDLEKEVMRDAFEDEAFEGLSQLKADELAEDLNKLQVKLKDRTGKDKKPVMVPYFRLAAAILILTGIGTGLYLILHNAEDNISPDKIAGELKEAKEPEAELPYDSLQKEEIISEEKTVEVPVKKEYIAGMKQESGKLDEEGKITLREEPVMDNKSLEMLATETLKGEQMVTIPKTATQVLKGRVLDEAGNPLPGVNIVEKGTTNGVVSDIDGKFELELIDPNNEVTFAYIGYLTENLKAENVQYADVVMTEDKVALEEVVVVGYGSVKKADLTGAVAKVELDEHSSTGGQSEPVYLRPVPPGESLKAYKNWIYSQLDYNKFRIDSVKYHIKVSFTVNADGSLRNIEINDDTPQAIKEEIKRVISDSPSWKPAEENEIPVEAKLTIRLRIDLEEK
jgi:cytochrome c-type biogenesis protein CcmE